MQLSKCVLLVSTWLTFATALNVSHISDCPALLPRDKPVQGVTDLRIDDIKVMAALGDSIMAGYGIRNIPDRLFGFLSMNTLTEFRGESYIMGGDKDAITVANFMRKYNPRLIGPSIRNHILSYVKGRFDLHCKLAFHPPQDHLNAASTGAMAMNLESELDYLIPKLKESTSHESDWKLIHIHIGSNDLCRANDIEFSQYTTPLSYAKYVEAAVERIRKEVPYVLVNIIGMLRLSDISKMTLGKMSHCRHGLFKQPCDGLKDKDTIAQMDLFAAEYDEKLQEIAKRYKPKPKSTFGIMFTPASFDFSSMPIDALSNLDCFHPSLYGHQWIAKSLWNQLFLKRDTRQSRLSFDPDEQIYCPTDNDRIEMF
ncbi:hypothetical protein BD560DRAFT_327230 [Blakeslea trispora]|nr:hypothetical protein BD560DRAFT_327230 [Blakeslea trispora]